jgi:membrane protein DedA with SNARE-associated domain
MHLDLPHLIDAYGYITVAIGALLEGETILALAGLAAHRGYLNFWTVVIIAGTCGWIGDQIFFSIGRRHGKRILATYPKIQARTAKIDALLERWHAPVIIAVRFMYGFRIAGPIIIGMGRVTHATFAFYNAIGAIIWANLIAGLGYLFGTAVEAALHDLKSFEKWGFAAILVIGLVIWLVQQYRAKKDPRIDPG